MPAALLANRATVGGSPATLYRNTESGWMGAAARSTNERCGQCAATTSLGPSPGAVFGLVQEHVSQGLLGQPHVLGCVSHRLAVRLIP